MKESKPHPQLEAYGYSALMTVSTILNVMVIASVLERLSQDESLLTVYGWEIPLVSLYMALEKHGIPQEIVPMCIAALLTVAGMYAFDKTVEATKKI